MTDKSKQDVVYLENTLIALTREFLLESQKESAINKISLDAHFEKDLGLDSLGRVELFHRAEEAFGVQLGDEIMIQSQTLRDLNHSILNSEHAIITPERKMVLNEETQAHFSINACQSLVEILQKRAANEGSRTHIYLQDETGNEKIITYSALLQGATAIANGLQAYGIEPGETVAIMLPTCEDFFYSFFGILLIGAIPVPLYPPFRPDKIEEYAMRASTILKNAQARVLITFDKAQRLSELLKVFISSLHAVTTAAALKEKATGKLKAVTIHQEMPALIQYTSGSTSAPKGVLLSHQNILANIRAIGEAANMTSNDVVVSWLPLYHDMGLIGAWLSSFYHASPVVILSPLSFLTRPERWLWAIHYHRATMSAAPNFAYELCVRRINPTAIAGLDLSSWRLSLNGAEAVRPKTILGFTEKFEPFGFNPQTLFPVYGLAESSVALTFPPLNRVPKIHSINRVHFEQKQEAIIESETSPDVLQFVSCGMPLKGHAIRIVNTFNEPLAECLVGHIQFKGPSSMMGYYRQQEQTQDITHEGWLDTGDLGYLHENELYITGRKKDIIIKAGRNLYPDEIEEITSLVPFVRKGCVIAFGAMREKWETEKLIIVAETKEKNTQLLKNIKAQIFEKVATVLGVIPDEVILVSSKTIPKTSSGKLQRQACKQAYLNNKLTQSHLPVMLQMSKLYFKSLTQKVLNGLKRCAKIGYTTYVSVIFAILTLLVWTGTLVLHYPKASKWNKWLVQNALKMAGYRIQIINQDKLISIKPLVYVVNHASYIDALVLMSVLPSDVKFVTKKELLKVPLFKTIIKKLKYLTVDREDFSSSLSDLKEITENIKKNEAIVIFPEGTFSYATGLRPFKLGAFKIAMDAHCQLLPIALNGTRDIFRGDMPLLKPGKITMTIGDLITPQSQDWQEIAKLHELARTHIAAHCGEQSLDYT